MPSQSQVVAVGRHVVTYAMGAATALAALHVVSAGDAATISNSITQISSGVAEIATGMAPLIAIVSALWSAWSSSHKSQIAAVNATPGIKVVKETNPGIPVTEPPKA